MMSSLHKRRIIGLSFNEVCYEEDFLEWLKSYRHTDRDRIRENPELNAALTSDFPKGRYNQGLLTFLLAFHGLLARPIQRSNVIYFKDPTLYQVFIKSHRHYALVYIGRRRSQPLFRIDCRKMEQLVGLVRWLREPTKSVGRYKGIGHGQRSGLHLSNARKDALQLRFSEMSLRSAPGSNAIVADQMEVEIQRATPYRLQEET